MGLRFNVISVDDHVQEPPDLWTQRLSQRRWGDRVPHVARQPDGTERWVIDGRVKADRCLAWTGALSPDRSDEPQTWGQVPRASYDPAERLKAMDEDQVDVQVLYPGAAGFGGEVLGGIGDPALEIACVQA
ncbi:MAG: amidohydrolase, partial [Dehalococcoidia bacterium]